MQSADLFLLLLQGALLSAIPIALVWAVRGRHRLVKLASVTAFLTYDLVVFGAFTRLTDSGLGCPDWPGCFAKANPMLASGAIARAAALAPDGPVDMTKAWIEMIHRALAMAVGLLIVVLVVMTWRARARGARPALAMLALSLVLVQGAFGAFTVTLKLAPLIVSTHLLLALCLFGVLMWQAADLAARAEPVRRPLRRPLPVARWLPSLALLALIMVAFQIALGGWVSTNYAVLACSDFPRCQGSWVPAMDFTAGYSLWHPLGLRADGSYMPIEALTAIHWTHRNMALPVGATVIALAVLLWRRTPLRREALIAAGLIAAQIATGLANVLLGWPLVAAVLHSAGAAALVGDLVLVNYRLRAMPLLAVTPGPIPASALP